MRKNFVFFLGAVVGAGFTFVITGPQGAQLVAAAKAATGPGTYSQLNLFGEVFERIRTSYIEKPDDAKLIEASINGMITSLDPHSRYMNEKAWRDMQETTSGEFGPPSTEPQAFGPVRFGLHSVNVSGPILLPPSVYQTRLKASVATPIAPAVAMGTSVMPEA